MIALAHEIRVIDEGDNGRRGHDLRFLWTLQGGVEQFQAFSANGRRRGALDGIMDEAVEDTCAGHCFRSDADSVDGRKNLTEVLPVFGGDGHHGGVGHEEEFPSQGFPQFLQPIAEICLGVIQIELIGDQNTRFVDLEHELSDFPFLHGHAFAGINDEGAHIGAAHTVFGLLHAEDFDQ